MNTKCQQISNPFRVFYDQQKNRYYRINKVNGQTQPSYKSGKTPAKFDPQISGTSYKTRKVKDYQLSIKNNNTRSSVDMKNILMLGQRKTIPGQCSGFIDLKQNNKVTVKVQKYPKVNLNKQEFDQNILKKKSTHNSKSIHLIIAQNNVIQELPKNINISQLNQKKKSQHFRYSSNYHELKTLSNIYEEKNPYYKSIEKLNFIDNNEMSQSRFNIENFQHQLKRFAIFQESKTTTNYRQLKTQTEQTNYLETSLPSFLKESNIIRQNDVKSLQKGQKIINKRSVNSELKNELSQKINLMLMQKNMDKSIARLNHLQSNISAYIDSSHKQKLKLTKDLKNMNKQKAIFLQFHPGYVFKENQRAIKEQKDRKLNFKKLQKLFIDINNKQTSKIYRQVSKDKQQSQNNEINDKI